MGVDRIAGHPLSMTSSADKGGDPGDKVVRTSSTGDGTCNALINAAIRANLKCVT